MTTLILGLVALYVIDSFIKRLFEYGFFDKYINEYPIQRQITETQSQRHLDKTTTRVVVMDGSAYWVINNVFYTADMTEEGIDTSTARTVQAMDLSEEQVEELLFVLDNLIGNGNENASGSTGNE